MKIDSLKTLLIIIFTLSVIFPATPAFAAPELMVLLDASGTMAAPGSPGSGATKFAQVRSALTLMLQELPAEVSVGLRILGGSPSADCYVSFLYISPTTGQRSFFQDQVASIVPSGKRALITGIEDAIIDLSADRSEEQNMLLVITDDGDDCSNDYSILADRYRYGGNIPRITIVGLDLSVSANEGIGEFVADVSGQLLDIDQMDTLEEILVTYARSFSDNLRVFLQDSNGNVIEGDVVIRNASTNEVVVDRVDTSSFSISLEPGTYEVTGRYLGQEIVGDLVTVGADRSGNVSLVFSIYRENYTVVLRDLYSNAVRARVSFIGSAGQTVLTTDMGSTHHVALPADTYTLEIRIGDNIEYVYGVLVAPGVEPSIEIELPIEIGTLMAEVYNHEGLPINAEVRIYDMDGTIVDEAPFTSYLYSRLPEGTYRVEARLEDNVAEETVYLFGGDEIQVGIELQVPIGDLFIMLRTESGDDIWGFVRIYDSYGNEIERFDRYGTLPAESPDWYITGIPIGIYRIEAQSENVIRTASGIEVMENEETEVTITFPDEQY